MSKSRGLNSWIVWLPLGTLVVMIGFAKPLVIVVMFCFAIGSLFLSAGIRSRRPIKKQSFPIPPEEIEGRVWETIVPGSGNLYLRLACLGGAVSFYLLGVLALSEMISQW